jgi:hypothetical protein
VRVAYAPKQPSVNRRSPFSKPVSNVARASSSTRTMCASARKLTDVESAGQSMSTHLVHEWRFGLPLSRWYYG